jgi:hypothetical protein
MTNVNRILTTGDFSTLGRLVDEWNASGQWIGARARKILENSAVVFAADLPPDIASLGSRVSYAEKGRPSLMAELTALCLFEREYLPIRHPLGLALLGRREGEEFDVHHEDGCVQRVRLEKVLEQPERTWPSRYRAETPAADGATAQRQGRREP